MGRGADPVFGQSRTSQVTDLAIQAEVFLNQIANLLGGIFLAPISFIPELTGAIAVSVVTGIAMLIVYKYTSRQAAIKAARNGIKAELLALSLFKDNVFVNLRSQFRIVIGAFHLLRLSLVPMAVMMIPIGLMLGQLSLWWQARPLHIGEEAVVTVNLSGDAQSRWPEVLLRPCSAAETMVGPVRVRNQRAVCWKLEAKKSGSHQLVFNIDGQDVVKDLAIGDHLMRVSVRRPEWKWADVMLYPAETPLTPHSPARSIEIQYPSRSSWSTGKDSWVIFWFVGSTIAALLFQKVLKVNL